MFIKVNNVVILRGDLLRCPCEVVVRYFLPGCRVLLTRKLIEEHHFTQVDVAKILGISQPAVSHYLSSKRGDKYLDILKSHPKIQLTITKMADGFAGGTMTSIEGETEICRLCSDLRNGDIICRLCRDYTHQLIECNVCRMISNL